MARSQSTPRRGGASRNRYVKSKQNRVPWWIWAALGVLALAIVALVLSQGVFAAQPGQAFAELSRDHIPAGSPRPAYNSDPPTSGPHYANPAPAAFYDQPRQDEELVHNLEHGHIWIAYDCSKLSNCEQVKTQLKSVFDRYNGWKIVITPRQNKDADAAIALVAWGRLEKLPAFDQGKIDAFVKAYRDKGPEQTME